MSDEKKLKIFQRAKADALFLEKDHLRRYLTGFYSTDGYVVLTADECVFFADPRYFEAAEAALAGTDVKVLCGAYKEALEYVAPYKKLGVPYTELTVAQEKRLKRAGHTLTDCTAALTEAMLCKTPQEIVAIGTACTIAEDSFYALLPEIKEGMTENETAALLEYNMRARGASGTSFETIVAFGENGSVPHHETGTRKLRFGDPVLIDFGCKFGGYCSDCTRTFLFGDDGKHQKFKEVYAHVLGAHLTVLEELHSGMTGQEADEIARGYLRKRGLADYFTHSLGHGVGLLIHESPVLSPRGTAKLCDGMVFSDEPGVYLAGELGIRIEDTVYLKDGKAVSFMKKDKNLIVL